MSVLAAVWLDLSFIYTAMGKKYSYVINDN